MINKCEKGDRIVALRMSRIARSMKTLCDFFSACEEKGVLVDIIHEQFETLQRQTEGSCYGCKWLFVHGTEKLLEKPQMKVTKLTETKEVK